MAKYTPTTIAAGLNSQATINANFQTLADLLNDQVLFRDLAGFEGDPNAVQQDIDMNSNRIINLDDAVADGDAATLRQIKNRLSGTRSEENVTAVSGGQTLITFGSLTYTVGAESLQIHINGVFQPRASYTETSTSSITLSEGINTGDVVQALALFE